MWPSRALGIGQSILKPSVDILFSFFIFGQAFVWYPVGIPALGGCIIKQQLNGSLPLPDKALPAKYLEFNCSSNQGPLLLSKQTKSGIGGEGQLSLSSSGTSFKPSQVLKGGCLDSPPSLILGIDKHCTILFLT